MNLEGGRCFFAFFILTGFLLGTAYGEDNTTTMAPTTTPATTPPMTTTAPATVLSTTISPTTPVETTNTTTEITDSVMTTKSVLSSFEATTADPCSGVNCYNGGTCDGSTNPGTCNCAPGWMGDECSKDVDECTEHVPFPCDEDNGSCTNTDGSYECTCNPGYIGNVTDNSTCIEINECDPNPCQNGGNCTDMVNDYTCTCLEGKFNGTNCETDIRECTYDDDDPCYNNATCIEQPGSYECNCTPGFTGNNCEINCPADTYGAYCVGTCTCVAKADCSRIDGSCTCVPAFDGAVCNKRDLTVTAKRISPDDAISEGNNFTLACEVNLAQTDLVEVAWYRSGEKLPSATGDGYFVDNNAEMGMYNITILSAGAKDTGNYSCTAVTNVTAGNNFTVKSSEVIVINVLVVGKIIGGAFDERARLNETAMLNCTAFSSQSLTLAWERHGQPLSNVNRTTVTNETGLVTPGGTYYSIFLEVMGIVRADNGIYQCIVMDQDGNETDRGNFSISVLEVPDLSNPRYLYNEEATQLTIAWNEYDVNTVTTICTAFYNASGSNMTQEMSFGNPERRAIITGLTPYTTYSVSLICQNEVGRSKRLFYGDNTTFQGAPDPPTNVIVSEKGQRTALVSWSPPEVINGVLAGFTVNAVQQNCNGADCATDPEDIGSDRRSYQLLGLSPGAEYKAFVRAYTEEERLVGESKKRRSEPAEAPFMTQPDLPASPHSISARDDGQSCIIDWEEPSPTNGIITSYTLTMNTTRLGDNTLLDTEAMTNIRVTSWTVDKSELPVYSNFTFSVTATNAAGEGPPSKVVDCQREDIGEPEKPKILPAPSTKNHYSFTTAFPAYNDRNGPVSCYEVVVVQLQDANAIVNPDDDTAYFPGNVKPYEERAIGTPYIALVMDRAPADNKITIGMEDEEPSTCHTGGSARQRRSTVTAGEIKGVNGPLNPNGIYTSFVRVYSPSGEDQVYFENGPVMAAVTLDGRPPNTGAIVGAIFGVIIALCIAFVVFLMYRRRQKEVGDPLMTPTTNGPRENGNGTLIGMENLEMVVEPIKLERLEKAIREKAKDEKKVFWDEYKALPNRPPPMVTMNSSNHPANKDKNRYINIIAYDHTRVKLKHVDGIEGSDYINASYVNGYQSPDKFIAAQGPKDNTLEDFWRMIWECNCSTIVMLTKCVEDGKDKCSQYWPNTGSVKYGRFEVKLDEVKETAEYVIRSFFLSENDKETGQRSITQFHFLGWPDHGQPDYPNPMLCLIKRVRHLTSKMNHRANIVVHCSAGVGRTGTYIVIDAMLDKMKHEKQVDIYNFIHEIRQQRNTLVQSFVQYFFIHIALLEEHLFGHMDVGMSDFPAYYQQLSNKSDYNEDLTRLEEEFRRACKLGVNGTEQTYANIDQNKDKNRIGHILPFDKNIVKLERLIGEEFSDYINASYITGYDRKNMYIATQGPLPNTIADFWRMIWESQTSTIVMLTETTEKGHEMCAQYWPLEVDEVEEHGNISVTLIDESDEDEAFTVRDIEISHAQMKDIRKIRQYHFRGWPEVGVPDTGIDLMRLVNKSHLHQKERGAHPIVVHCSAGAGRTGVFIGLNILMSRMEEESMIDVFQTVRGLRQQRPHMVQDLAQYKFCYLAMVEYIQDQSTEYQNFVPRV